MSAHPHTREAIERWQQGKINIFDALAELEDQRDAAQAECLEQARLLGKSAEREDVLRTKAEQQKKEILKYTAVLEDIRAGYEGTCYACEPAAELNVEYRDAARELIRLLDIEEESDSGTVFRPNKISSCRVMDGMKMNQCLKKLKELSDA
jgi:hypothetical protein